ncbi:hypothetical protein IW140_002425 [Coemansia sp. RSA 1813]|nr:hypothetical protein EV178_000926 [Coemansia sp. RSA 1646]KAJ1773029.1 hypothetical protein LPJ74_000980 [Coemansia sp. RSA 1843]KAJ2215331.1 hypothetical protein EV179_002279 [Coemansia sp. RSA 487]KAJ2570332.1 hypothetical protein IW140_002425 [Coemansia sp. RSA 1813]
MSKEERPRGLRARLRQRKARASSEDEVRSRPVSLDLGSRHQPMLHADAMHSTATMPVRADTSYYDYGYGGASQENSGGLALGEFGEDGSEVAEDEQHAYNPPQHNAFGSTKDPRPSGAIVRSHSQENIDQSSKGTYSPSLVGSYSRANRPPAGRRESSQSVPTYDAVPAHGVSDGYGSRSDDGESGENSGNYSYNYSYDDESNGGHLHSDAEDLDAEGELNAVYLKRNTDFHGLFRNIPIDELLIDDYICALQRDILVQGRLYLTENYVCFFSNIFGWVTSLTIAFDEILSMEKKMTALIIPNAIQISTLHAKHAFSSFMYRDSAYNQLYDLWTKSKSEKNAGLPEIGRAEDGTGAGDVSRHREDVLNAYQSLTEESDDDSADEIDSGSDVYSGSAMNENDGGGERKLLGAHSGYEEESTGSISDTESEGSNMSGKGQLKHAGADKDLTDASQSSANPRNIAGTGSSILDANGKVVTVSEKLQGRTGSDIARANGISDGALSPIASSSSVSPAASQAGMELTGVSQSSANRDIDVSRIPSQLSAQTAKAPTGANAAGTSLAQGLVTSLASGHGSDAGKAKTISNGTADKATDNKPLLAKLPKTPDVTDAVPASSLTRSRSNAKKQVTVSSTDSQVPLHKPTNCPCGSSRQSAHYGQEALDTVFPLSLPLLFRIVFSAAIPLDVEMMYAPPDKVDKLELDKSCTKHIIDFGNSDVKTEGWVPDPSDSDLEMCIYSYDKPLGFSIGPKSTTVEDTFRITMMDFDTAVIVEQVVRTPNVPSGTAFFVKIRHCLTWTTGPGNHPPGGWSHYRMTFEVEWVKSSWIKSAIERGTADSNKQAGEMLEKYIRSWIAANPCMEVKEQHIPHIGLNKTSSRAGGSAVSSAAYRRARKAGKEGGKKSKHRDQSPEGLRMEELLGERSGRKQRGEDRKGRRRTAHAHTDGTDAGHAQDHMGSAVSAVADASEAGKPGALRMRSGDGQDEKDAWERRADESWAGWACYHSVYPIVCVSRWALRTTRATLAGPISGPAVIFLLLALLAFSNIWRFAFDSLEGSTGSSMALWGRLLGSGPVRVDRIEEVNGRIDLLAAQVAAINKQLELLAEMQK